MRFQTTTLRLLIVLGVLLGFATGCREIWRTPTATPTEVPTPPPEVPAAILQVRSAAFEWLRSTYLERAPAEDTTWTTQSTSPADLSGVSYYEFASDAWRLAISSVVISSDNLLYEMDLANAQSGFRWTGKLDTNYSVRESNLDVAVEVLVTRDLVLSYVAQQYASLAPEASLVWVGERTTPMGSVGRESCRFVAGEWAMGVEYDVVRPDQTIYETQLWNTSSGFLWRGQVDAQGTVQELRPES